MLPIGLHQIFRAHEGHGEVSVGNDAFGAMLQPGCEALIAASLADPLNSMGRTPLPFMTSTIRPPKPPATRTR